MGICKYLQNEYFSLYDECTPDFYVGATIATQLNFFFGILPLNALVYGCHNKLLVLHMLYQNSMITYRLPKVNSTFNITFKITNLE